MKHPAIILTILLFSVFSILESQLQAAEATKNVDISYNKEPNLIKQLNMDFKKQWHGVLRNYPAVAIAFMHQETALAMFVYQRVDYI